jgi:CBS domain containing-hemolysin-like protein
MVPAGRLLMIDADAPWATILETAAASPFSRLPAYRRERQNVVGVLRVKDLVHRYVAAGAPDSVDSLLRPFIRVAATMPGDQVIATLRERRAHQAAVVDESGAIAGFLTIQDVLGEFLGPGTTGATA